MPRRNLEMAMRGGADPIGGPADDYLVEGEEQPTRPSAIAQAAQFGQVVLIALIAVLSLAVFWLLGTLLGIL
ncbi:MAG TPA: hypothetical protein VG651_09685 [Stellaceae bacterium]|nr:hypothetical protein [Stellaceae bacterium]